jgi:hypothetical protein
MVGARIAAMRNDTATGRLRTDCPRRLNPQKNAAERRMHFDAVGVGECGRRQESRT